MGVALTLNAGHDDLWYSTTYQCRYSRALYPKQYTQLVHKSPLHNATWPSYFGVDNTPRTTKRNDAITY